MDFFYKKNNEIFKGEELAGVKNVQNYIPLYDKFFELNSKNYNSINLNNSNFIKNIEEKLSENKYRINITDKNNDIVEKNSFIKFSPLLDPIKYIIDKYDKDPDILVLPKLNENICHNKMIDSNNLSYVDSFFSFLSSTMLHNYSFINGIDFYGSFLGIKTDYVVNIEDEIEILNENENFHKNKNIKYSIDKTCYEKLFNNSTKKNKHKIILEDDNVEKEDILNLSDIKDLDCLNEIFNIDQKILKDISNEDNLDEKCEENKIEKTELVYESDIKNSNSSKKHTNSSSSSCSSRSSDTEDEDSDEENDSINTSETSSEETEENIFIKIREFPVQLILLENCKNTLDDYIVNNKIRDDEWDSIVLQIIFTLITYQQTFDFTHNDLHTNNIVYIETDKKYIYYRYKERHYKVPTFGKIYKIIDFGRAIYTFKGNLMCSDSFSSDGDAHTQYNFEPYFNKNKPRLEPNYSFDLCRLGCSIFDFFIEDLDDIKKIKSPIKKIILEWIKDDKGRNILYKNNGEERYPDFKLYKMIARSVHNHVPSKVLENQHFDKYLIAKKRINNPQQIINIDNIPVMK